MKRVRLSTLDDYAAWLELAKEVEPLFGPMTDVQSFCDGLRQAIGDGNALCCTEREVGERHERLLGGILISGEANEIAWLAVAQESRGHKIGTALLSEALKHLDRTKAITVTTFDRTAEAGAPARRLYESFGFRDSPETGVNPAGIPTVTMTLQEQS